MKQNVLKAFELNEEQKARQELKLARQTAFKNKYPNQNVQMTDRFMRMEADAMFKIDDKISLEGNLTANQLKRYNERFAPVKE